MTQQVSFRRSTRAVELYGTAAVFWLIFAATAAAAGIIRETWVVPRIGELRAHQAGTLAVCAVFLGIILAFIRRTRPSRQEALSVGMWWLVVAIAFEFGFGHYAGRSVVEPVARRLRPGARASAAAPLADGRRRSHAAHPCAQPRRSDGSLTSGRSFTAGRGAPSLRQWSRRRDDPSAQSRRPAVPPAASRSPVPARCHLPAS